MLSLWKTLRLVSIIIIIQTSLCVFRVLGEAADQDEQIEHLAAALVRQESDSGQEHPSTLQLEFHSRANG